MSVFNEKIIETLGVAFKLYLIKFYHPNKKAGTMNSGSFLLKLTIVLKKSAIVLKKWMFSLKKSMIVLKKWTFSFKKSSIVSKN